MARARFARVLVATAVIGSGVVGGLGASAQIGDPTPFPSPEEVQRYGFAVWPEDTVEEAQAACADRADDDPWRLSARETALHFAIDVLHQEDASILEAEIEEEWAQVSFGAKGVFLYNFVDLRRADVCWYITRADYREPIVGATPVFAQPDGGTRVYLETYGAGRLSGLAEIGFGAHTKRFAKRRPARLSWTLPPDSAHEGHIIVGNNASYARALPPPPIVGAGDRVWPTTDPFSWGDIATAERRRVCRRSSWSGREPRYVLNNVLEWQFSEAMPSGPYPRVIRTGAHGWIGKRVRVDRVARGDWTVTIDGLRYSFRVEKATHGCWALARIRPLDKYSPIQEAFVVDNAATVDFVWGAATRATVELGYGHGGGSPVHDHIPSRVAFYLDPVDQTPGAIFIVLYRDGKIVNAFSRRIPPMNGALRNEFPIG
jgi:hypothetical protein